MDVLEGLQYVFDVDAGRNRVSTPRVVVSKSKRSRYDVVVFDTRAFRSKHVWAHEKPHRRGIKEEMTLCETYQPRKRTLSPMRMCTSSERRISRAGRGLAITSRWVFLL